MKRFLFSAGRILLLILLLASCAASPPVIKPVAQKAASEIQKVCAAPFPRNRWQWVHSIETSLAGGHSGMMLGVTVIAPKTRTIRSAMMTIEGLVVFNGEYTDDRLTVERAIPPFDADGFARGMMEDIRLMFLYPPGPVHLGTTEADLPICRFENGPERMVDITFDPKTGWTIRGYRSGRLVRTVLAEADHAMVSPAGEVIPRRMTLTAHDSPGYTLHLKLLEARPLTE